MQYLYGVPADVAELRAWVRRDPEQVRGVMRSRATQTNEAARCAALLPLLGLLDGPLALIEVGASAGLCLYPDRYSYDYDGRPVGADPARSTCAPPRRRAASRCRNACPRSSRGSAST